MTGSVRLIMHGLDVLVLSRSFPFSSGIECLNLSVFYMGLLLSCKIMNHDPLNALARRDIELSVTRVRHPLP